MELNISLSSGRRKKKKWVAGEAKSQAKRVAEEIKNRKKKEKFSKELDSLVFSLPHKYS